MKNHFVILRVILAVLLLSTFLSCKKEATKTAPILITTDASAITQTIVISGGNITEEGGAAVSSRGVCWSRNQSPSITDSKTSDGSGAGSFSSSITGLNPGMTYYFRAYATNSVGTAYGNQVTATTPAGLPTITTTAVSTFTTTTATSGGNVTSDGGSPVTARGVSWYSRQSKTIDGTGTGTFTSLITELTPGFTYDIYAYATNSVGTAYGDKVTVTTKANLPTLTTKVVSITNKTTATSGAIVTANGGAQITSMGVCWSTTPNPTISDQKTTDASNSSVIAGLLTNTTYYVRAYATNSAGTAYGNELAFILYLNTPGATVYDIDGNLYHTVKIGTQTWMVENLRSTHYANGLNIENITSNSEWYNLGQGYCWYNNNIAYKNIYGALYSYWLIKYASIYGGICPEGWHISSDADWTVLINYLGGDTNAGSMYIFRCIPVHVFR